jgi:putative flippase GtrA
MQDFSRFVKFGIVGAVGFIVDAGILQLLVSLAQWGPIEARILSFPSAVAATWLLNRHITFRASADGSAWQSLVRYVTVSIAGATVNFAVYTALILLSGTMAAFPTAPLAAASITALVVNYMGSKHFAFRPL